MLFLPELLADDIGSVSIEGNAEQLEVSAVTADSRMVTPGSLFVAIRGTTDDGSLYASDAVEKGAMAVVADKESKMVLPKSVPVVKVENARLALAKIAAMLYAPQPQCIAAVTGTDGKTSTADFLRQLLNMSDRKAASIGTLGILDSLGNSCAPALNTTPDPVTLHQTLQALARDGYQCAAIEASSHGLDQYRLDGVHIQAAAFTNLTRDHLDYHHTQEAYFSAKLRLFAELLPADGVAVLNADDATFGRLAQSCRERGLKIISYGHQGEDYQIKQITPTLSGLAVQANIMGGVQHFMLNLIGGFQAMNAMAALGLYVGCGGTVEEGLPHLPHLHHVRGRLEKVAVHPNGAAIFVDYAHTPAALAKVLQTMRRHARGKLVVVFGCGGDRDKGKRPEMGRAANDLADEVIVTDDNPRSENPAAIRTEIMLGVPRARNIGDRAQAIAFAIQSLDHGDLLLIAGKGHETTQLIGKKTFPFNDAEVARDAVTRCE